jgi:hypothetical protein
MLTMISLPVEVGMQLSRWQPRSYQVERWDMCYVHIDFIKNGI